MEDKGIKTNNATIAERITVKQKQELSDIIAQNGEGLGITVTKDIKEAREFLLNELSNNVHFLYVCAANTQGYRGIAFMHPQMIRVLDESGACDIIGRILDGLEAIREEFANLIR